MVVGVVTSGGILDPLSKPRSSGLPADPCSRPEPSSEVSDGRPGAVVDEMLPAELPSWFTKPHADRSRARTHVKAVGIRVPTPA